MPTSILAQNYKCTTTEGKTIYQAYPCPNSEKLTKPKLDNTASLLPPTRESDLLSNIPFGKSAAELVRLVPGTKIANAKSTMANGAQLGAELDTYTYAGRQFQLQFYFKSDKLTQLHLSDVVQMGLNAEISAAFEKVAAQVRRNYGAEFSKKLETSTSGLIGGAEWRKPGVRISLSVVPMTQAHSSLVLNFFSE